MYFVSLISYSATDALVDPTLYDLLESRPRVQSSKRTCPLLDSNPRPFCSVEGSKNRQPPEPEQGNITGSILQFSKGCSTATVHCALCRAGSWCMAWLLALVPPLRQSSSLDFCIIRASRSPRCGRLPCTQRRPWPDAHGWRGRCARTRVCSTQSLTRTPRRHSRGKFAGGGRLYQHVHKYHVSVCINFLQILNYYWKTCHRILYPVGFLLLHMRATLSWELGVFVGSLNTEC